MNYQFLCPKCFYLLEAEGEWGGESIGCPECGQAMTPLDERNRMPMPADLAAMPPHDEIDVEQLAPGSDIARKQQQATVTWLGLPVEARSRATDILFRLIPPGSFIMGSSSDESGRDPNEQPRHVTLTQPFYCGKYPVTQGQWLAVMGVNPSNFQGPKLDLPVECVSWDDCQEFCQRLCRLENVPEHSYRLMTEAEWEYVCRAGTRTATYAGDLKSVNKRCPCLEEIAWYDINSGREPHLVGQKRPNAWGVYDMLGNVYEWCLDCWCESFPDQSIDPLETSPEHAGHVHDRVTRGGSWFYGAKRCRAANRYYYARQYGYDNLGLRIIRTLP